MLFAEKTSQFCSIMREQSSELEHFNLAFKAQNYDLPSELNMNTRSAKVPRSASESPQRYTQALNLTL
jgi:hypothetical protein